MLVRAHEEEMKMKICSLEIASPKDHPSTNVLGLLVREEATDIERILSVMMKESAMIHQ
jgi:hypothetical protein